ncbi:MAG: hypothetical protein ACXADW_22120 [Candidatus Hodarchaeales archaeon]
MGALRSNVVGFKGWINRLPNRHLTIDLEIYKLFGGWVKCAVDA